MLERLKSQLRISKRSPFSNRDGHVVVHCCHHRVGTNWFRAIFESVSASYGLPMTYNKLPDALPSAALHLDDHSHLDRAQLPESTRGSHMVRDPRDIVVSAYHYHRWCDESWATKTLAMHGDGIRDYWHRLPVDDFWEISYRDYLNRLDPQAGLEAELLRASTTDLADIEDWDPTDPRFLEVRYEDLIKDELGGFAKLFRHYGFHEKAVSRCLAIAEQFSFDRVTQRRVGEVASGQHLRSGAPGQWREAFTPRHKALFKDLHGQLLIDLGYEQDLDW